MDAVTRRVSLTFLLEFALRQPDRQVLVLSPQVRPAACWQARQTRNVPVAEGVPAAPELWRVPARTLDQGALSHYALFRTTH